MKKTRTLTEIAVSIALAVVCSFIRLWEMPQGGSVALTMIPILLVSYRKGATAGMLSGSIYGVLSVLLAGTVYHPASIFLDYILAFGAVGIAGFFKKNIFGIIGGTCVGVAARFLFSFISGAVIFAEYAPAGQNPFVYSAVYQATYLLPELAIALGVLILLYIKGRRLFEM